MYATPLNTLAEFFNYSRPALVFALVSSALATFTAMRTPSPRRYGFKTLALLIPQQFFMLMAAGGSMLAVWNGYYADGVIRTTPFILADQSPWILAALLYTVSIVDDFGKPVRERWTHST